MIIQQGRAVRIGSGQVRSSWVRVGSRFGCRVRGGFVLRRYYLVRAGRVIWIDQPADAVLNTAVVENVAARASSVSAAAPASWKHKARQGKTRQDKTQNRTGIFSDG